MRKKSLKKSVVVKKSASPKKKKFVHRSSQEYPYDVAFELLMVLVLLAKAGRDVNSVLVEGVEPHLNELATLPEFQVALGAIPRPAGVLTVHESEVQPLNPERK